MHRIIVINNDIDTMSLLQSWLERKSYKVKYTGDPEELLVLMSDFKPSLVIADILQAGAVKLIKSDKKTKDVPVILMTGYTLKEKLPEVEIEDIIEKPFNLDLLQKKIERLIA